MDAATTDFYRRYAEDGAIREEAAQSAISKYFSQAYTAGGKVLDVGAGSGRDLAQLLDQGFDAYGIEPNDSMRTFALHNHPMLAGRLQPGALPAIESQFGGLFDGVLCSAVMMHIPDEEIAGCWESIRGVLKPKGRVLISLPFMRADLLEGDRDRDGRLFKNHSPASICSRLKSLGFSQIDLGSQATTEHSATVWSILLFELTMRDYA